MTKLVSSARLFTILDAIGQKAQSGGYASDNIYGERLSYFADEVTRVVQPTLLTLSSSRIEVKFDDGDSDFRIIVTGNGIGPVSSMDALIDALDKGIATGGVTGITVTEDAHPIATVSIGSTGYVVSSGTDSVQITGSLPATFSQMMSFDRLTGLFDVDTIMAMTATERKAYFTDLGAFGVSGFDCVIGGKSVVAFSASATGATLRIDDLTLNVTGTLPTSFGAVASILYDAVVKFSAPDAVPDLRALNGLGITSATITSATQGEVLRLTGPVTTAEIEMHTIYGTAAGDYLNGSFSSSTVYADGFRAAYAPDLANSVYRLYDATLNRVPDAAGHLDWTHRLAQGQKTLAEVAAGFVSSTEFRNVYGSLDNRDFVELLYRNVLNREGDAGGIAQWVSKLDAGTSRAQVVLGFSESTEFKRATAAAATSFATNADPANWGDDVFRLYQATLDRTPDVGGFQSWCAKLAQGMSFSKVVTGFVDSAEFKATYGNLSNGDFVRLLYRNVLDREADTAGFDSWMDKLANGATRAAVVEGFSQSREFAAATAPDMTHWMQRLEDVDLHLTGKGVNEIWSGAMQDQFVFDAANPGTTIIHDFDPWDMLVFRDFGYQGVAPFTHMREEGGNVVFEDQGVTITLVNTTLSSLQHDNVWGY